MFKERLILYFVHFKTLLELILMTLSFFSQLLKNMLHICMTYFPFFKVLIYGLIPKSYILDIY